MTGKRKIGMAIAAALTAFAAGGALFIESGYYDIGADDHHTKPVLALIEQLRDRSIEVRSRTVDVRYVMDPARIAAGAQRYAALCAGCHLAPGVTKSDIRPGLYPHPPNLAQEELQPAQRAFWVVKHGIKMSAMPAWGKTLDDAAIWDIVAFVRKMPAMTPETYQELSRGHAE
jgi:mono/diheme cytochrome c family protein